MTNPYSASHTIFYNLSKKMGFFDPKFLTHWQDIVGKDLAQKCTPSKMIFDKFSQEATLIIFSTDVAFKSMLTHYKEILLNKIKFYFGVNFVKNIKIAKI